MDAKGGNMMCRLKVRMEKKRNYNVQIRRTDGKGRHYELQMKGWMQKGAL